MAQTERRVKMRLAAEFKVDCLHEGNYLISHSKNISADGMFVSTPNPPALGTYLKLIFSLGELHEISVAAKVVWINHPATGNSVGMGVQFLNPPPLLKETMLHIINRIAVLEPADVA